MKAPVSFLKKTQRHWVEILVFSLALIATILAVIFVSIPASQKATYADVSVKGEIVRRIELNQDATYQVDVPHGTMQISVKNGKIAVFSSPCPGQYCVHQGEKEHIGDTLICAHEGVAIYLVGEGEPMEITI